MACVMPGFAHDSWLISDKSVANSDDEVWLSFVTGEEFPFGDKATAPSRVASFVDKHGKETTDIPGYLPQDKGLSVRRKISGTGLHVIGVALRPNTIELAPEKFEAYLHDERADAAIERFAQRADKKAAIFEEYTKFAKTIISVEPADENDKSFKAPAGHRLEIIPLTNPCRWKMGQTVKVEVLLDGFRWKDVPVSLGHEGTGPHQYAAQTRTNDKGVASFTLGKPGHAFIKAHFIRPRSGLGKVSWESYWASLTFRVQGDSKVNEELRSIRNVHGDLTPGAVLGFRAGRSALEQLGLSRGEDGLHVLHQCPTSPDLTSMADGVQAATGATLGRLSLELAPVPNARQTSTIFTNQHTGRTLTVRFPADIVEEIEAADDAFAVEALALRLATMPDELLFVVSADVTRPRSTDPTDGVLSRR